MNAPSAADLCARLSHWAVLAAGVLVSSAASGNHAAIDLLRRPVVAEGTIADGFATVTVAPWFPVDLSILSTEYGELYARVRDLFIPLKTGKTPGGLQCAFDVREVGALLHSRTFKLSYFPWFRFLAEPVGFEAEDSVADYVAECIRFLVVREGAQADVEASHDSCVVHCANGMTIAVEGMESLQRIVIAAGAATSSVDFGEMRMTIDRRMFPEAFAMGHDMLATSDRLANMEVEEAGDHLVLRAVRAEG